MICFIVLAELPISTNKTLMIAPLIACIVPYIWGFLRTASIGNHAGALGTLLGVAWLVLSRPDLTWTDYAPYFLLINVAGNASGWLGAVAGQGQKRDSVAVTILEFDGRNSQTSITQLHKSIKVGIEATVHAHKPAFKFYQLPDKMVMAERDGARDVLDFAESSEWRQCVFPQLRLWRWYKEVDEHSINEIVDHATSILKFIIIKAQISLSYKGDSDAKRLQALITTSNETSTIVWVDSRIALISRSIHNAVLSDLRAHGVKALESTYAVLHKRHGKPNIEQRAKQTVAAKRREHIFGEGNHSHQSMSLLERFEEAFTTETWFDRFRGRGVTFVIVLIFQVFLGLGINWVSSRLP